MGIYLRAPVSIYFGAVDAALPVAPNVAPLSTAWTLFADSEFTDDGLEMASEVGTEDEFSLNEVLPVDGWISSQMLMSTINVKDSRLEAMSRAFNGNAVRNSIYDAGPPEVFGFQEMDLEVGSVLHMFSVLFRLSDSPYDASNVRTSGWNVDIVYPRAAEVSNFNATNSPKGEGLMYPCQFKAYKSRTAGRNCLIRAVNADS